MHRKQCGFTLIELLVVIGIIALLAAIIFPVFSNIRETNRATTSMSNLHDISSKLELYRLDHQAYPPVLFGYQYNGAPMDQSFNQANAATTACGPGPGFGQPCAPYYFPGLYPEYINNINEFRDPNDDAPLTQTVNIAGPSKALALCAGTTDDDTACGATPVPGSLVISARATRAGVTLPGALYAADAYDSSPVVSGRSTIDASQPFVVRYSTSYTAITSTGNPPANLTPIGTETQSSLYTRQLRWLQPPGTSYVACTTWHVPQSNRVLMLLQDGSVHKTDTSVFLQGGADGQIAVAPDVNGDNSVTTPFWKVNP